MFELSRKFKGKYITDFVTELKTSNVKENIRIRTDFQLKKGIQRNIDESRRVS